MTAAATAMGKAVTALNDLKTGPAIAPEMEALNHLLRAQADTKQKQQISNQQAASGGGGNRSSQDLSSLFDRELQRQQQTNYETPSSTEQRKDANASLLDKISDLARRQDELLRRQRDLAQRREQMSPEDVRRELEKLTREQSDLRQRAEDLAQQMPQRNGPQQAQSSQNRQNSQGQQSAQGQQNAQGQQQGQQNQQGAQGSQSGGGSQSAPGSQSSQGQGGQMRAASDEMRGAAGDLRRQDPAQASARGQRALDRLREVERQLRASAPDEARRARGDLQMEARQLADAQRELESDAGRLGQNDGDGMRRLAGEQERLAERARRLQQGLNRQGGAGGEQNQQAIAEANRAFGEQRIGERMQQSADEMRTAAGESGRSGQPSQPGPQRGRNPAATTQRDIARALDDVADRLASADGPQDADTRRISDQLARAHELRERLNELTNELAELGERTGQTDTGQRQGQAGRQGGQSNGRQGGQQSGQTPQQPGQPSSASSSSSPGGTGQGTPESGTDPALARLREEYARKLQEARELLDQLRRDDNTFAQSGPGFTFEGQGMVLSAPGTESFKQDFSKWDALRKQATQALERAESSLSQRLQGKASRDRLAAGVDDAAPAEYQRQVDSYFKALATKPK
jgi:hypothetical protein